MQKLRLAFRGWSRRRDEEAKRKEQEFLQRNVTWGNVGTGLTPSRSGLQPAAAFDLEGLQIAYLDDSGKIAHYLDADTGEVIEFGSTESRPEITGNAARYKRVPTRSSVSDDADRRDFAASLDKGSIRDRLLSSADAAAFRRVLASDRTTERAWYNFKNERATQAIARWLKELGL
jgi:hypothetical protein